MQTAAGGPLRIKFDPERIARLKYQMIRIPGMNNSGGDRYRKESVRAQQHQEQETKRKEEEIKSRMEMRPILKRKATTAEKLQGKKDEYKQVPQVVGMSGADPLLSFYIGGIGLNGVGALTKTGLWNIAKYAPTTQLGNWGRGYFVGNAFKNSFNGNVPKPVINPQTRTRVGDVEIDNPQLAYRQGTGIGQDFLKRNKVTLPKDTNYGKKEIITPGGLTFNFGKTFNNPMFAQGKLWYGLPEKTGEDLLVTAEPLSLATQRSNPISSIVNGTFDIRNHLGGKAGVRRIMLEPNQLNISNTTAYTWKPGYGYQKIISEPSTAYFGDPTQNFLKFTGNPKLGKETAANSTFYGSEKNLVEELKLLKSPTSQVPTKSTVFNPYIIDSNGKMHINWDDILIQHKYGGKIK